MAGWFAATIGCTFFCEKLLGGFFGGLSGGGAKAATRRDLAPGSSNERFALFYTDAPTARDYSGVAIDTNGLLGNVTAEFKFPDGTNVVGNLTGYTNHFNKGIGYGNFSADEDSGQWITVDLREGAEDVTEFFQWLVEATQDGNVTAEEFKQAVDILRVEATTS